MGSTAKIAHLILAHRNTGHLVRTIGKLVHPNSTIYIHLDKKAPIADLSQSLHDQDRVIFIKNRVDIKWGAFSMVTATLRAFEEILNGPSNDYDFINLISESDYPLVPATVVHDFLAKHKEKSFMEYEKWGSPWIKTAQTKVFRYHLVDYRFPGKYFLQDFINKLTPQRKMPMGMELVGRSQWFTICTKHVRYVLDFTADHPKVVRFFKHTWGPDEFYFQTILFNSSFKSQLVNNNLRYIDWSEGNHSPKTLTEGDYGHLVNSGKYFARKFNTSVDAAILDKLDSIHTHE